MAEQKMAERLAALGIKAPAQSGETTQQRVERENRERLQKAEAEDARRDQERQRRLESEQITPPAAGKSAAKKPPPPPSRKNKQEAAPVEPEPKRANHDQAELALREQQEAQEAETKRMEYVLHRIAM
jgi:hypothetical protein